MGHHVALRLAHAQHGIDRTTFMINRAALVERVLLLVTELSSDPLVSDIDDLAAFTDTCAISLDLFTVQLKLASKEHVHR